MAFFKKYGSKFKIKDEYLVVDSTQAMGDSPCLDVSITALAVMVPQLTLEARDEGRRVRRVEQAREAERIQLGCGKESMRLVGRRLKEAFENHAPQYVVKIELGTYEGNLAKIKRGSLDLMLSSLPLSYRDKTRGLKQWAIATVAMVARVPVANPLWGIKRGQLADLLSGRTTNWSKLTSLRLPVQVLDREHGDPFLELALVRLFPGRKLRADVRHTGPGSSLERILRQEPAAIALLPFASVQRSGTKMLAVDGVLPTATTIRSGQYPLIYKLYLISSKKPRLASLKAISFVTGTLGRRLLADLSLIVN